MTQEDPKAIPIHITQIEWLGVLADDFDSDAAAGGVFLKPGVLKALAFCLRRVPFGKI